MKRINLAAAALVMTATQAYAEYFDNGNKLLARCKDPSPTQEMSCIGTVSGMQDMMVALGYVCQIDGVNREQLKDVLVKYLIDAPEQRNQPAAVLAIRAFQRAFACKRPKP